MNQTCITVHTPLQAACGPLYLSITRASPDLEPLLHYLLDHGEEPKHQHRSVESRVDVTVQSGWLGYPINAASLYRNEIINLICEQEGATVQVRDDFSRMPIHFAALIGMANFDAILAEGGDLTARWDARRCTTPPKLDASRWSGGFSVCTRKQMLTLPTLTCGRCFARRRVEAGPRVVAQERS